MSPSPSPPTVSTGVPGLDDVLGGGLPAHHLYLLQGDPGVGKTTLGLQFLMDGHRRGEKVLYVTLSETVRELHAVAVSHGWNLEGIPLWELSAAEQSMKASQQSTFFHPSEIELSETTQVLLEQVERVQPARVVFDSLSELRLMAQDSLRFRRQILALKHYFTGRNCTVLLLDNSVRGEVKELSVETLAHGIIMLEQEAPLYGGTRRRIQVLKLRGARFRGGYHDYTIETGGLVVFPRIVASEHRHGQRMTPISSGIPEIDKLLGGGVSRGSSMLIVGPAGAGKSALSVQYATAAASRGEKAVIFLFDERIETMYTRSQGMGNNIRSFVENGMISVQQIDPAELQPGEFAHHLRKCVDAGAKVVVVDSLNGYMNAMPEERFLVTQMHELLAYLGEKDILTIMIIAQHGVVGSLADPPIDMSYLADTALLIRYFEAHGQVRQAISVVKKRTGSHERTIREFQITSQGIRVGQPLHEFQGVLTGVPTLAGSISPLLAMQDGERK